MMMQETYTDALQPSSYLSGILTAFEWRKKLAENYSLVRIVRWAPVQLDFFPSLGFQCFIQHWLRGRGPAPFGDSHPRSFVWRYVPLAFLPKTQVCLCLLKYIFEEDTWDDLSSLSSCMQPKRFKFLSLHLGNLKIPSGDLSLEAAF